MLSYIVKSSVFSDFTSSSNGGVINLITTKASLSISCVTFYKCVVGGTYNGGCIYYESKCGAKFNGMYASECSAYYGFCSYVTGSSSNIIDTELNGTTAVSCKGKSHAVCSHYYSNGVSRDFNSSFCYCQDAETDLHYWYPLKTSSSFCNFFMNKIDLVYGVDSSTKEHYLSYSNFLSNEKCRGKFGLIHTYYNNNCQLTIDHIYAFNNSNSILSIPYGTIVIQSLECDTFKTYGNAVDTTNVELNPTLSFNIPYSGLQTCNKTAYQKNTCKRMKLHYINKFMKRTTFIVLLFSI